MKNNWQKDIHDRLGNYGKDAPKGLWEEIRKGTTDENGGYMNGGSIVAIECLSQPSFLFRFFPEC